MGDVGTSGKIHSNPPLQNPHPPFSLGLLSAAGFCVLPLPLPPQLHSLSNGKCKSGPCAALPEVKAPSARTGHFLERDEYSDPRVLSRLRQGRAKRRRTGRGFRQGDPGSGRNEPEVGQGRLGSG